MPLHVINLKFDDSEVIVILSGVESFNPGTLADLVQKLWVGLVTLLLTNKIPHMFYNFLSEVRTIPVVLRGMRSSRRAPRYGTEVISVDM